MEILAKELTEEFGTVKISIRKKSSKKMNVYVQTVDSIFRPDLNCIKYTDRLESKINEYDLDDYESDFKEIIKEAEDFIKSVYKIKYINSDYVFKIFDDKVILSEVNRKFINADSSPYQTEYYNIREFEILEEAEMFFKSMKKDD